MKDNRAKSKLCQGVTTEVMGQCGNSIAPLQGDYKNLLEDELKREGITPSWGSFGEYLDLIQEIGLPVNVIGMVGHGTLRKQVMGYERRKPSNKELSQMKEILRSAMRDGAFGMTTGLIYPPGSYADNDELVELLSEVSHLDGIYMTHMRNEGSKLLESVKETITVSKFAWVKVQISHHKSVGRSNWGKVTETLSFSKASP